MGVKLLNTECGEELPMGFSVLRPWNTAGKFLQYHFNSNLFFKVLVGKSFAYIPCCHLVNLVKQSRQMSAE